MKYRCCYWEHGIVLTVKNIEANSYEEAENKMAKLYKANPKRDKILVSTNLNNDIKDDSIGYGLQDFDMTLKNNIVTLTIPEFNFRLIFEKGKFESTFIVENDKGMSDNDFYINYEYEFRISMEWLKIFYDDYYGPENPDFKPEDYFIE